jgi:hypothetical protein
MTSMERKEACFKVDTFDEMGRVHKKSQYFRRFPDEDCLQIEVV